MADFIKHTLKKVNREQKQQQPTPITLFAPLTLKTMNVTQLQIVINEIYDFRGILNEALVKNLVERDELLSKRDAILLTIEKNGGRKRGAERENLC
jgi:Schwannomin-interacting protein 1